MLYPYKKFEEALVEMRNFGEYLIPYNIPQATPQDEEEVNFLKTKEMVVDGYSLIIYFNKADWGDHYLEILQISGKYVPFLPFSLVCKIGKKFLGDKCLSYVDFIKDSQKTYCWTVVLDKKGEAVPGPYKKDVADCSYEGFCYTCLNPASVNFY